MHSHSEYGEYASAGSQRSNWESRLPCRDKISQPFDIWIFKLHCEPSRLRKHAIGEHKFIYLFFFVIRYHKGGKTVSSDFSDERQYSLAFYGYARIKDYVWKRNTNRWIRLFRVRKEVNNFSRVRFVIFARSRNRWNKELLLFLFFWISNFLEKIMYQNATLQKQKKTDVW